MSKFIKWTIWFCLLDNLFTYTIELCRECEIIKTIPINTHDPILALAFYVIAVIGFTCYTKAMDRLN